MISLFEQRRHNAPDRFDGRVYIGIFQSTAAVVQADDAAVGDAGQDAVGDGRRGQLPVAADHRPHDAASTPAVACISRNPNQRTP